MNHHLDHAIITLRNPNATKNKPRIPSSTDIVRKPQQFTGPRDVDIETRPVKHMSKALAQKMVQTRTGLQLNQGQFAQKLNLNVVVIQELEKGKLASAEANKIANKAQCVFKLKIL